MAQSDVPKTVCLVALATAWGPRFGGINAFNVEWLRSIGIAVRRYRRVVCVVPNADDADQSDAKRHSVALVSLGLGKDTAELPTTQASAALAALRATPDLDIDRDTVVWIGHDDKTGPLALKLREALPDSRAVLVHHMAFRAYQGTKKNGGNAEEKKTAQQALFEQADLCLAVGPMLAGHLRDILLPDQRQKVVELVPGLSEPDPKKVPIGNQPPEDFVAFLGGRLGSEDEIIKQPLLGVRGFGRALKQVKAKPEAERSKHALNRSPCLRMRGLPGHQHDQVRQVVETEAGGLVECDLQPYTEDRNQYLRDLALSSVALMPSWHEGFGLVAWEAIACQVPVVIGEQSGVYRLLHNDQLNTSDGSVRAVRVDGEHGAIGAPQHTEHDVDVVATALLAFSERIHDAKQDAVRLAGILRRSYSWKKCANTTLRALQKHLGLKLPKPSETSTPTQAEAPALPQPPKDVPQFLLPPTPRRVAPQQLAPSALLAARDQVVRFHPARDAFVDGLLAAASASDLPRLTLAGVHGPGGIGKTRSALELLRRAGEQGWTGLWLPTELPDDALQAWQTLLASHPRPLLLLVDYAEGRQPELLRWLRAALTDVLGQPDAPRIHLLCLSRATDWWAALSRQPDCGTELTDLLAGPANLGLTTVPDWPDSPSDRAQAFTAALHDYAAALEKPLPAYPWQPDFSATDYARPLYLHMAALAALNGERPSHGAALLAAQLRREWKHWQRDVSTELATPDAYEDWADALALLALTQGLDADALGPALQALGVAHPARLAAALTRAYPRDGDGAGPLLPDLLAEHLIVDRLSAKRAPQWLALAFQHDQARLTQALNVLARLWPNTWPDAQPDAASEAPLDLGPKRLIDALSSAWPQNGQRLIEALHQHGIALRTPVTASWQALSPAKQTAIAPKLRLPDYSTPLLGLTVEIRRRVVDAASNEPSRAEALYHLSIALSRLGDAASLTESLDIAYEVVKIYLALTKEQHSVYLPNLAASLNNLAIRLRDQGDDASRTKALCIARKTVRIYRALTKKHPTVYRPNLSASLNTLANRLIEQGDNASRTEALRIACEVLQIDRKLAQEQPATYLPILAKSLNNLATHLFDPGDAASHTKALDIVREAVQIRRALAQEQPSTYLPT